MTFELGTVVMDGERIGSNVAISVDGDEIRIKSDETDIGFTVKTEPGVRGLRIKVQGRDYAHLNLIGNPRPFAGEMLRRYDGSYDYNTISGAAEIHNVIKAVLGFIVSML